MPQYIVLKTSANQVPPDGSVGTADVYLGTHADAGTAVQAAAAKWNLAPNVAMWVDLASNFSQYHSSVTITPG